VAALVSCAVGTGAGAAWNAARVTMGSVVLIFGAGGVGLSALLGSLLRHPAAVVVVDPVHARRQAALDLGASYALPPGQEVRFRVQELTDGRGADVAIEASGTEESIAAAYAATRAGGRVVIVGACDVNASVTMSAFGLYNDAKILMGCQSGSADAYTWLPQLLKFWSAGKLPCERMITSRVSLADINSAVADVTAGRGLRSMMINQMPGTRVTVSPNTV
jgi:S-(hydroxymethyl)glutathione dehydrogenase/alcohol dehydrogenase